MHICRRLYGDTLQGAFLIFCKYRKIDVLYIIKKGLEVLGMLKMKHRIRKQTLVAALAVVLILSVQPVFSAESYSEDGIAYMPMKENYALEPGKTVYLKFRAQHPVMYYPKGRCSFACCRMIFPLLQFFGGGCKMNFIKDYHAEELEL